MVLIGAVVPAVLFVQLGCDAMWELIPLKKKTKNFALSVRLVFKLDRSLLQFMVLLAVAQGSSTAKERGQGRTEHHSVRGEKSWKGLVP